MDASCRGIDKGADTESGVAGGTKLPSQFPFIFEVEILFGGVVWCGAFSQAAQVPAMLLVSRHSADSGKLPLLGINLNDLTRMA